MRENNLLIVSLYDRTANWPRPYIEQGYGVICWDKTVEGDILSRFDRLCRKIEEAIEAGYKLRGLLTAPPCTHFASSGARWWADKDASPPAEDDTWNEIEYAKAYVSIVLHLVELYNPHWWVLENPVGRLETMVPEIKPFRRMAFDPSEFGDPYTKKTILWGVFNEKLNRQPCLFTLPGFIHHMPSSSPRRSITPLGFSRAFAEANP